MTSKFQQRLVGIITLAVIGVVVLPILLDGKKKHYKEDTVAIPLISTSEEKQDKHDEIPHHITQLPAPLVVTEDPLPVQKREDTSETVPSSLSPKPTLKPSPSLSVKEKKEDANLPSYVVQLGALKNATQVNTIVLKLKGAGYPVFTVPTTPVQGQMTRIYVGPDKSKAKMSGMIGKLKQLSGLEGVVKPYKTTKP